MSGQPSVKKKNTMANVTGNRSKNDALLYITKSYGQDAACEIIKVLQSAFEENSRKKFKLNVVLPPKLPRRNLSLVKLCNAPQRPSLVLYKELSCRVLKFNPLLPTYRTHRSLDGLESVTYRKEVISVQPESRERHETHCPPQHNHKDEVDDDRPSRARPCKDPTIVEKERPPGKVSENDAEKQCCPYCNFLMGGLTILLNCAEKIATLVQSLEANIEKNGKSIPIRNRLTQTKEGDDSEIDDEEMEALEKNIKLVTERTAKMVIREKEKPGENMKIMREYAVNLRMLYNSLNRLLPKLEKDSACALQVLMFLVRYKSKMKFMQQNLIRILLPKECIKKAFYYNSSSTSSSSSSSESDPLEIGNVECFISSQQINDDPKSIKSSSSQVVIKEVTESDKIEENLEIVEKRNVEVKEISECSIDADKSKLLEIYREVVENNSSVLNEFDLNVLRNVDKILSQVKDFDESVSGDGGKVGDLLSQPSLQKGDATGRTSQTGGIKGSDLSPTINSLSEINCDDTLAENGPPTRDARADREGENNFDTNRWADTKMYDSQSDTANSVADDVRFFSEKATFPVHISLNIGKLKDRESLNVILKSSKEKSVPKDVDIGLAPSQDRKSQTNSNVPNEDIVRSSKKMRRGKCCIM